MTASNHAVKHRAKVDTLVVAGPKRADALPNVPNQPEWTYTTTWGIMAPPGTPADRVAKLNAALNKATADPKVRKLVTSIGLTQMRQTPAEAKAYVDVAIKKFSN